MNDHEHAMIQAINAARVGRGVHALAADEQLAAAARGHAADLRDNPALIASGRYHVGSDGSSIGERIARVGYEAEWYSEITAWGWQGEVAPAVDWWLKSPAHVGYVLASNVSDIGVGFASGGPWGAYWCVNMGRREGGTRPPPPRPHTSHIPVVVGAPTQAPAPQAAGISLLDYLCGDGRAYMLRHPDGQQEKLRTVDLGGGRWLQLKNSQWEELWVDAEFVWRGADTSPGDGQYYRQFEDGQPGARWGPRRMAIGQVWESPAEHTVQTYWKGDCRPAEHHRNGRARNRLRLVARHERMTWNGVTVEDVIQLATHTSEGMYFGRGWGLVAWMSPWGQSAISHVLPAHEADNEPERGCYGP